MDVMMPKMDGITVLTRLRESGNQIPVLMLTAKAEIDDRVLGLDSGRLYEKIWKQVEQEEDDPAGVVLVYISYLQTKLKALHADVRILPSAEKNGYLLEVKE